MEALIFITQELKVTLVCGRTDGVQ